jgi:hypothetical protein
MLSGELSKASCKRSLIEFRGSDQELSRGKKGILSFGPK